MPVIDQSARISLVQAFLGAPVTVAYGRCWVAGNEVLNEELADKSRIIVRLLGEGPWKQVKKLFANRKVFDHTNTSLFHFHPGRDGAIGDAMAATSTGGDQKVDAFFTSLTGLSTVTWSRSAYYAIKLAPDPGAPSAAPELIGDFETMLMRQFNSSGVLTAYDYSENPAWWTHDLVLRKWFLRGERVDRPLNAAERARFAWSSWSDAAAWCEEVLGGGQKRWSQGGAYFADERTLQQALDGLLVRCLSSLREDGGQIILDPTGKRRSYAFTFNSGNARNFRPNKDNLRSAKNEYSLGFANLDVASGDSGDGETRFAPEAVTVKHRAHQRAIGTRGPGLAAQSQIEEVALDLGTSTRELAHRIARSLQLAELGLDVEDQRDYLAPFEATWESNDAALRLTPGDVVRIDRSLWMDTRNRGKRRYLNVATRVVSSGGSNTLKYSLSVLSPSVNGTRYEGRIELSNLGTKAVTVDFGVGASAAVQPGETKFIEIGFTGDGATAIAIRFNAPTAGDALDFVAFGPSVRRLDTGAEVVATADFDFEGGGWAASGGATITVTQGENLVEWPLLVEVLDSSAGAGDEGGGDLFKFGGREYNPLALQDAAPAQQQAEAPDPGTGIEIGQGISSVMNPQGSVPPVAIASSPLNYETNDDGLTPGTAYIRFTWNVFVLKRSDQTDLNVAASSALALPAAPTLSQVAGGALGARTRYARVALVREKMMYAYSNESSLAISANNLLKVASPAAVDGYDGWIPLIGSGSNNEEMQPSVDPATPIAFGTDWTEPTGGATVGSTNKTRCNVDTTQRAVRVWNLGSDVLRHFAPTYRIVKTLVEFPEGPLSAKTVTATAKQWGDGMVPLNPLNAPFTSLSSPVFGGGGGSGGIGGRLNQ